MSERIQRHALSDRLFHWVMAVSVLILLATAFLPIAGIKFSWVTIHWIAGVVLTLAVLFHIVRSLFWKPLGNIWYGLRDARETGAGLAWLFRLRQQSPPKPGKFSPAQKLMHLAASVLVLAAVVTGLLMMVKIDTPFWKRNPYWLEAETWGIIYVLHGAAALILLSVVMIHIYFAFRPEKWKYTRSMLRGWLRRDEYLAEHDPQRWKETS